MNCKHKIIELYNATRNGWITKCRECGEEKIYMKEGDEWKIETRKRLISAAELRT